MSVTGYAVKFGSHVRYFPTKADATRFAKEVRASGLYKKVSVTKRGSNPMKRTLPSNTFIALPANTKAIKIDKRTGAVVVATGSVPNPRRARNTEGFKDANGVFHPIRSGDDYDPEFVGESSAYSTRKRKAAKKKPIAKKKKAAKKKATAKKRKK